MLRGHNLNPSVSDTQWVLYRTGLLDDVQEGRGDVVTIAYASSDDRKADYVVVRVSDPAHDEHDPHGRGAERGGYLEGPGPFECGCGDILEPITVSRPVARIPLIHDGDSAVDLLAETLAAAATEALVAAREVAITHEARRLCDCPACANACAGYCRAGACLTAEGELCDCDGVWCPKDDDLGYRRLPRQIYPGDFLSTDLEDIIASTDILAE